MLRSMPIKSKPIKSKPPCWIPLFGFAEEISIHISTPSNHLSIKYVLKICQDSYLLKTLMYMLISRMPYQEPHGASHFSKGATPCCTKWRHGSQSSSCAWLSTWPSQRFRRGNQLRIHSSESLIRLIERSSTDQLNDQIILIYSIYINLYL